MTTGIDRVQEEFFKAAGEFVGAFERLGDAMEDFAKAVSKLKELTVGLDLGKGGNASDPQRF